MSRLRSLLHLVVLGCVAATLGCAPPPRPDGAAGLLPVGAPAPDVVGEDPDGRSVKLSDFRGRFAVVYFYPKDGTPGCTTQADAFRDAYDDLGRAGVVVFGVSRDSAESHRAFRQDQRLPFPMVADESGAIARAYGVPPKFVVMSSRVTFLIDREGKVAHVWPDVDPSVDARRVLETVRSLSPG